MSTVVTVSQRMEFLRSTGARLFRFEVARSAKGRWIHVPVVVLSVVVRSNKRLDNATWWYAAVSGTDLDLATSTCKLPEILLAGS